MSPPPRLGRPKLLALCSLAPCLLLALGVGTSLFAQELEPRTYSQTPTGVKFIAVCYGLSAGNVLMDPVLPIEGEEDLTRRSDSGAGDVRLNLEVNLLGAPALRRSELGEYDQRWIAGASLKVVAPTGDYEADKLLNLGSNRWTFRPEMGFSRAVKRWTFDGAASVWFFTENGDFFAGNGLTQRPLYVLKGHVIYSLRPGFFTEMGAGWGNGGQTSVNDVPRQTLQSNWRFSWLLAYPITPSQGLVFGLGRAVTRGAGGDYDTISLGYQYA